jgi:two-component system sensor kinase FixL
LRLLIRDAIPLLVVVGVTAAAGFAWVAAFAAVIGTAWIILRREREILTERVRLHAAEAKFWQTRAAWLRAALDNMPDAVVVADENARPQIFNPAAERILGLGPTDDPPSEWSARYGTYYADGVTPYPTEKLPMVRALAGEDADEPDMFLRNERQDGLWLSASARPLRREDGAPWGAVLVCHDMTERKRAVEEIRRLNAELESRVRARTASLQAANDQLAREIEEREQVAEALRQSEKLLRTIVDHAPSPIYLKDLEGRYLVVPHYYEQRMMLGEATVGKTDYDIFPKEVADTLRMHDRQVIEQGRVMRFEESVSTPARGTVTMLSSKFPLFDDEGRVWALCGISTDITERKQMEAELQRSEAALSAVIESTTDAVWSVDRDYQVVTMNSAVKRHFAKVFGELDAGGSFAAGLSDEQRRGWRELYDRVFAGERVTTEKTVEVAGVTQHFLISMSPIREGSEVTGATVFSHDISDLRHTEELARAHQAELTHVLRLGTLGEIASELAHEINQPLGAISNYAAACSRWVESGGTRPRDLQRGLEMIASEAIRAGEIIRRLRDLARKGEGGVQVVDLNGIVCRAAALMEPETRLRGISLRVELAKELPRVCADGIQIEQVVLNLLLNGVEAMQMSPLKELSVSTATDNGQVAVSVRDSGVGLVPAVREHVFDAFFTTKASGLGMGLAISRRIIDAHGGQLCGEPNPGGPGSTFSFSLPVAPR